MRPLNRSDLPVLHMALESIVRFDEANDEKFGGQRLANAEVEMAWDDMTDQTARIDVTTPVGTGSALINYAGIYWPQDRPVKPADCTDAVGTAIATALATANTPAT